ncbi:MAG TPA: RDD family protein [Burkholderiales bacterium]|nr:RDD family protein [Burkholderiales bacterium]
MPDEKAVRYAGFWVRLLASLIDIVILLVLLTPLSLALSGPALTAAVDPAALQDPAALERALGGMSGLVWNLVVNVVMLALVVWFWRAKLGTPGKMVLKLRVVDAVTFKPLSTGQCVGRALAYLVSTIPLGLGFLWIAFDPRKQGWHDKLVGSVVIHAPKG